MRKDQVAAESSFLDKPLSSVLRLNGRTVVLCLIVLALVVTRLYDLSNRAYSHDESTHAWESWKLFTGQGYRFDPVYHGPFLYHITAFVYFLLGVSDATARIAAALFAVAAVLLVWPMRRWLGRAGALFAMLLLTISPTLMFRGRFIRHDIFVITPSMAMVIAFFRYLEERKERWLYLIAATLSLTMCAKGHAFINGAIFGSFWVLYLVVQWVRERAPLKKLPAFDLIVLLATLALPMASALVLKVLKFDPLDYSPPGLWRIRITVLLLFAIAAAIGIWWKRKTWLTAVAIFYTIFVPLYTTLFTNVRGIEAGFVGILGHWTSQQSVARGEQPWYYYFFLLSVYEFFPMFLSGLGAVYYLGTIARRKESTASSRRRRRRSEQAASAFVPFLLYWVVMNFAIFAWSGEKMPWQTQHLVMPLGLLGGWFLGKVWEGTDWRRLVQQGAASVAVLLPVGLFSLFILFATMRSPIRPFSGAGLEQLQATLRWVLALVLFLIVAALIYPRGRHLGRSGWMRICLGALCVALLAVTVRFAWMLSFVNQDYATEFLVYAASTPDTAAIMRELDEMSRRMIGSQVLRIAYDNESQQPFFWYLRDREGVTFFTGDTGLSGDPHVVIIGVGNESKLKSQLVGKYVRRGRDYRLIWWPDEEPYRNLTLAKLWKDLRDPARRRYWWDILWFRKYPHATTSWPLVSKFALYVRKDIAAQLWDYGPEVAGTGLEMPEDEYEKKRIQ
ncbi:MAG: TIGR03663 family protein, partial [Chloroflexi bacterium]|nr:TIGR03663 family protein [Chloroflexota bacterium]